MPGHQRKASGVSEPSQRKDLWDKLQAAGSLTTGLLALVIALVGTRATNSYNERQLELQQLQRETDLHDRDEQNRLARTELLVEMIPHLANEGTREAALVAINEVATPALATKLATTYRGAASVKALERIATGTRTSSAATAIGGLAQIAASGDASESEAAEAALARVPFFPSLVFSALPSAVSGGGSSTLAWSSLGAKACTATGAWRGAKQPVGQEQTAPLTQTSTFNLQCTGPQGSVGRSVTVGVGQIPSPAPQVTLSALPPAVLVNGTSMLTWATTNATSCMASGGWSGMKSLVGSESTAALTNTAAYTLNCSGNGGSASSSVTVTVNAGGGGYNEEDSGGGVLNVGSLLALLLILSGSVWKRLSRRR